MSLRRVVQFLAFGSLAASANAQLSNVIHHERSLYRNIYVTQEGDERCMLFRTRHNVGRETCTFLSAPNRHVFDYTRMMLAGLFLNPRPARVLVIGLGGGTIPRTLSRISPNSRIDTVELDPSVVKIADKYFSFRPSGRISIAVSDGRVFVKRRMKTPVKYDLVMLDAFDGDYVPEHMLTQNFLREVRSIMAPGGVLVANTFSSGGLYPYESATYESVFGPFYNLKAGNRVIVARNGPLPPAAVVRRNAAALDRQLRETGTNAGQLLSLMTTGRDWDPKTRVLTDQYSPSNVLNAQRP
jgi:spermidine synthase